MKNIQPVRPTSGAPFYAVCCRCSKHMRPNEGKFFDLDGTPFEALERHQQMIDEGWYTYSRILDLPVSATNREVIHAVWSRIPYPTRRMPAARRLRHRTYRQMLACHAHARQEFREVVR